MNSVSRVPFHTICLILVCSALPSVLIGGRAQSFHSQNNVQQYNRDIDSEPQHRYTMESGWNGCGGIPYAGWEGCTSQTGTALRCDDGARVYLVKENCTSSLAANNKRLSRLEKTDPSTQGWQIVHTEPLGDALLLELVSPTQVFTEEPGSSKWVCLWTEESSLVLIYGPDREHVLDYFKTRQKSATKPKGVEGI